MNVIIPAFLRNGYDAKALLNTLDTAPSLEEAPHWNITVVAQYMNEKPYFFGNDDERVKVINIRAFAS